MSVSLPLVFVLGAVAWGAIKFLGVRAGTGRLRRGSGSRLVPTGRARDTSSPRRPAGRSARTGLPRLEAAPSGRGRPGRTAPRRSPHRGDRSADPRRPGRRGRRDHGMEPGGAARMRARYMHITGPMLRKVAQQVGDALWEPPEAVGKTD